MAMNPRLLRPTANDSPASIPGLALWLDASASDALYTTDAGPVTAVSSPLDISGCALWLDGADSSAASMTLDGTAVSSWRDKSGNGRDFTAAGTARPTITASGLNGRSVVTFDGTDDQLTNATNIVGLANVTMLAVAYRQTGAYGGIISSATATDSSPALLIENTNVAVRGYSNVSVVLGGFTGPAVISGRVSSGATELFTDGLARDSDAVSGTLNAATTTAIGTYRQTAATFLTGYIAEIIVYPTALSASDRARVEAYLAAKWGISGVHAPAVTASDPVGYWRDRSGNGRHATQSTAASRPTVTTVNGRAALSLVSQTLIGPSGTFDGPITAYWAGRTNHASSGSSVFSDGSVAQTQALQFGWPYLDGPGGFGNGWNLGNAPRTRTAYATTAIWRSQQIVGGVQFAASGSFATVNGATHSTGLAGEPSQTTPASYHIGTDLSGWTNYNGTLDELLVYSRALSTAERRKVERYLARRWGITLAPQVGNAEAQDWINRVYAAGSTVSQPVANAVSAFVDGCQADGIWDAMKSVVLLAGADTLAGALAPLKGTAPTSYNFASGDYSKTSGLTVRTGTYIDSNFNTTLLGDASSFHMAQYCVTANTASSTTYFSLGTSGVSYLRDNVTTTWFRVNSSEVLQVNERVSSGSFFGGSRNATTQYARINGSSYSGASTPQAASAIDIDQFGASTALNPLASMAYYSLGDGLDLALLDARVSALMTAIGVS